jgi:hypothetical protein
MKKVFLGLIAISSFSLIFTSCSKIFTPKEGDITFEFSIEDSFKSLKEEVNLTSIIVSIVDADDELVYENYQIDLFDFDGYYITQPLSLETGTYKITSFLVVDEFENVVLATPIEGSLLADYVDFPLPLDFRVVKDEVVKLVPEVISTDNFTPLNFGYTTFSFEVVDVSNFMLSVFTYNANLQNFEMTNSNLEIKANNEIIYSGDIDAITNNIVITEEADEYELIISKSGYGTYSEIFSKEELFSYNNENGPLIVILSASDGEIIIQPDAELGKDTRINDYYPSTNYGDYDNMKIWAWTISGSTILSYSMIEFDLFDIPVDAVVLNAQLFLYHHPINTNSTSSGSNELYVERITSTWDEFNLTWENKPTTTIANRIIIPQTTADQEDKVVDVTELVQDMIMYPDESFGFLFKLVYPEPYRQMVFSFSDIEEENLRPMLILSLQ